MHVRRIILAIFIFGSIVLKVCPLNAQQEDVRGTTPSVRPIIVLQDDFETGRNENWRLEKGWKIVWYNDNYVLSGTGHNWASANIQPCYNYIIKAKVQLIRGGMHFSFRNQFSNRYYLAINEHSLTLCKQTGELFFDLKRRKPGLSRRRWYRFKIVLIGQHIKFYLDDVLKLSYTDRSDPLMMGNLAFETLDNSHFLIDEVYVTNLTLPANQKWMKTGGPCGGLGYDIRIHPKNPNIMFITDNPSGVNKSINGGRTWEAKNRGISVRTGASGDGVPVFCLTIDPTNPNIVWAGMQSQRGIYKSTDCGESWVRMDNGITEGDEITFRSFAVDPHNSDVVYAGTEISTGIQGLEFDRAKGKIYKTIDGGKNWFSVWEGGSLIRTIIIDPTDSNVVYAASGIFDREPYNQSGIGILKSTDAGKTWKQINNGLDNLFVGFLEMHPQNHNVLFAACGMNVGYHYGQEYGGVYRTVDGGKHWERVLKERVMTVVTFSPSNPDIIYAGSASAFYRSEDGGDTWQKFTKPDGDYGPPGIRAGVPISAVVHPYDPMTVFVNNYGGGCFKSVDGARTWVDSSKGYTGADLHDIAVNPKNSKIVYTIGRSGPFRSYDGGHNWEGLAYAPASMAEWNSIAINPQNPDEILITDEHESIILKSQNGGDNWRVVFRNEKVTAAPDDRHGFKAIEFAPSEPSIIYAGMRRQRNDVNRRTVQPSYGMYKSIDGGETWRQINNGLEKDARNINAIAIDPYNPDVVYIGTLKAGIYKTTDGGESWKAINNGLTSVDARSIAVDPVQNNVVYAGLGEGAGLFKSTDSGEKWNKIGNGLETVCPSSLLPIGGSGEEISFDKPTKLIAFSRYAIPWSVITSIVIDPTDHKKLYASDLATGVYFSNNGGKTWTAINNGLSTKAVTGLAISSDSSTLYASTSGEGVFVLHSAIKSQ